MRNLTNSVVTEFTEDSAVQMVSLATGEMHGKAPIDLFGSVEQHPTFGDFPAEGKENVLYVDQSQDPYQGYVWFNGAYKQLGGQNLDVVVAPINYVPAATGNTANLNQVVTDPNGDVWAIDYQGDAKLIELAKHLDVLLTVQPTPTATGNTTNLMTVFKDAAGDTWIVDRQGEAIKVGSSVFKELNRFYTDPNGDDTLGTGANEKPYKTVQKAVTALAQGDIAIINEGVYAETVTLATQNTTLAGASAAYSSLTQVQDVVVATASGTSNRLADFSITGTLNRTGNAALYLSNMTVTGNTTIAGTAYAEIKNSSLQDGVLTTTGASTLYVRDTLLGTANFNTPGSVVVLRDVAIDAGECVTIGAGVVYSLPGTTGCVNIDPAAIYVEDAAIAAGLPAAVAEATATTTFNKLRVIRADLEAAPTRVVTWDEVTGEVKVSSLESLIPSNTLTFGTVAPTAAGAGDDAEYFVTSDGTSAGDVLEQWVWDKQSATWIKRPTPSTTPEVTGPAALKPVVYNGSGYVPAIADADTHVADLIELPDGSRHHDGKVIWAGHGLNVGSWYYLSQTAAGGIVEGQPATGLVQQLFFVEDADTIHVDIEEANEAADGAAATAIEAGDGILVEGTGEPSDPYIISAVPASATDFAKTVYVNGNNPNTATSFYLDPENPVNDNTLKADSQNIYFGADGSTWTWNGTAYTTYTFPQTVKVGVLGHATAGYSLPNGTVSTPTYTTISNTAGGAWNPATGTFTAPRAGWYNVSLAFLAAAGSWGVGTQAAIAILKNGAAMANTVVTAPVAITNSYIPSTSVSANVYLNAGDVLRSLVFQNSGSAKTVWTGSTNYFSVMEN